MVEPMIAEDARVELRYSGGSEPMAWQLHVAKATGSGVVLQPLPGKEAPRLISSSKVSLVATADICPSVVMGQVAGSSSAGVAVHLEPPWLPLATALFPPRLEVAIGARHRLIDRGEVERVRSAIASRLGASSLSRFEAWPDATNEQIVAEEREVILSCAGACLSLESAPLHVGDFCEMELAIPQSPTVLVRALCKTERLATEKAGCYGVVRFLEMAKEHQQTLLRYLLALSRERSPKQPAQAVPLPPQGSTPWPVYVQADFQVPLPPPLPRTPGRPARPQKDWDQVLAQVFDAMHELYSIQTVSECVSFALEVAAAAVECEAGSACVMVPSYHEMVCINTTGQGLEWLLGRPIPLSGTLIGLALAQGETVSVADMRDEAHLSEDLNFVSSSDARQALCAPLTYDGRVFGALTLFNRADDGNWAREEVNVLRYIARNLSEYIALSLPVAAFDVGHRSGRGDGSSCDDNGE